MREEKKPSAQSKLYQSILIFLLALASITVASYAWFSLSDNVGVNTMKLDITNGHLLRMDIEPHKTVDEYYRVLDGERTFEKSGNKELYPVTSEDGVNFYNEDGDSNTDTIQTYLEVPLHFMASQDMYVHLSGRDQSGDGEGTFVSGTKSVEQAMRISFTANGVTKIHEPSGETGGTFTLDGVRDYREEDTLFYIEKEKNQEVMMRIWIEGTDPQCTDELREALYEIELHFVGTDENHEPYM